MIIHIIYILQFSLLLSKLASEFRGSENKSCYEYSNPVTR